MKKKILYFMPDNPCEGRAGNKTRATQLLDYLQSLAGIYEVDFLSCDGWGIWDAEHTHKFISRFPKINLILKHRKGYPKSQLLKYFFIYKLPNLIYRFFTPNHINISSPLLQRQVAQLIDKNNYDVVIVSYASFGRLIDRVKTTRKPYYILDTHDFMTAQNKAKGHKIGKMLQEEIDILKKYDEIWSYSIEEEYIFNQFTDRKVSIIPISFPDRSDEKERLSRYDVVYVASENPHNIKGATWLINEVLPHIPNVKVHVIGKVCSQLPDADNLVKHGVVDDISSFYRGARLAICPMLSGTGIKIKVLEAFSYGLPVVTNRRGVDGLMNKEGNGCLVCDNGADFAKEIVSLLHDDARYEQISANARTYFSQNHLPEKEKKVLDTIFLHERKENC